MTQPPEPWRLTFHRQAQRDNVLLQRAGMRARAEVIFEILRANPYQPPYEKLVGALAGLYSRRLTLQHRLVYQVLPETREVRVLRTWTHCE
jgi:Txe/YoeB family toxin of toxin-antitoxin system